MKTQKNDNKGIFDNIDHKCLIEGNSNQKCDHWGCKVTAKTPQYYPSWGEFFANRGTERFHIGFTKMTPAVIESLPEQISSKIPVDILKTKGYLAEMKKDCKTGNLNTGFLVEIRGEWPDRKVFNFDEVKFIHVEYNRVTSLDMSNGTVADVKEVAIYGGKEGVSDAK